MNQLLLIAALLLTLCWLLYQLIRERQAHHRTRQAAHHARAALSAAADEVEFYQAESYELHLELAYALIDFEDAQARLDQLRAEAADRSRFTRDLLLLNAAGFYSNVTFIKAEDNNGVAAMYLSSHNRIMLAPVRDDDPPPDVWGNN